MAAAALVESEVRGSVRATPDFDVARRARGVRRAPDQARRPCRGRRIQRRARTRGTPSSTHVRGPAAAVPGRRGRDPRPAGRARRGSRPAGALRRLAAARRARSPAARTAPATRADAGGDRADGGRRAAGRRRRRITSRCACVAVPRRSTPSPSGSRRIARHPEPAWRSTWSATLESRTFDGEPRLQLRVVDYATADASPLLGRRGRLRSGAGRCRWRDERTSDRRSSDCASGAISSGRRCASASTRAPSHASRWPGAGRAGDRDVRPRADRGRRRRSRSPSSSTRPTSRRSARLDGRPSSACGPRFRPARSSSSTRSAATSVRPPSGTRKPSWAASGRCGHPPAVPRRGRDRAVPRLPRPPGLRARPDVEPQRRAAPGPASSDGVAAVRGRCALGGGPLARRAGGARGREPPSPTSWRACGPRFRRSASSSPAWARRAATWPSAVRFCDGSAAPGLVNVSRGIAEAAIGPDWRDAAAAAAQALAGRPAEGGATLGATS